jgi:hypothetical protein
LMTSLVSDRKHRFLRENFQGKQIKVLVAFLWLNCGRECITVLYQGSVLKRISFLEALN